MTVGELKNSIKDLPDALPVYVHNPQAVYAGSKEDSMYYILRARHAPDCAIANESVEIELGDSFDW